VRTAARAKRRDVRIMEARERWHVINLQKGKRLSV
jgi:hypothetical protein